MKGKVNLELGILRIALLISAIDGHIDASEYDMFHRLLASCHIVSGTEVLRAFSSTRRQAERLAKMAATTEVDAVIKSFLRMVDSVCDWRALVEEPSLLRRAFAMWTAMALADNDYCHVEKLAINALADKVNAIPRVSADFLNSAETAIIRLRKLGARLMATKSDREKIMIRAQQERLLAQLG